MLVLFFCINTVKLKKVWLSAGSTIFEDNEFWIFELGLYGMVLFELSLD
jgi:hypothetical protein